MQYVVYRAQLYWDVGVGKGWAVCICFQGNRLQAVVPQQACSWEEVCWHAGRQLPTGSSPAALPACLSVAAEQLRQRLNH